MYFLFLVVKLLLSPNSMTAQESTGPVVRDVTPSAWSYVQHGKIMGIIWECHGDVMMWI